MAKGADDFQRGVGIVLIIIGLAVAFSGVGVVPLSVVSLGPLRAEGLDQTSAARIFLGLALIIVGGSLLKK